MATDIKPHETDDALIASYLHFHEDYYALCSGRMKDEASEHMTDLAYELRQRGPESYGKLIREIEAYRARKREEFYQRFPWRRPKTA